MSHRRLQTHKTHHSPDSGEATTFPHIVFSTLLHHTYIQNDTFSGDSQGGVLKLSRFRLLKLWQLITLCSGLRLGWGLKQTFSSPKKLSDGVSHYTCTHQGRVDSRLLVVRSQNRSCEAIFDIYASRPFQRYIKHLKARFFYPYNRALSFRESRISFRECECHPHTLSKWGCNIKPPPSFNPQFNSFHLWPIFKSIKDLPFPFTPMVENWLFLTTPFMMASHPLWNTWSFMFHMNKLVSFHRLPFKLFIGKLTSYYLLMALTPSPMLSLPLSFGSIWFFMLFHLVGWLWLWQLKQRKDLTMIGIWQLAFLPLTMEVFSFQHQQMNGFLHWRANMVLLAKGSNGLPLVVYKQKVLVVLQKV